MKDLGSLLADPLFQRLGWTLAAFLWQGALLAVLLACVNALFRRRRPEVRYAAACGALALMVALPIATFRGHGSDSISVSPGQTARAAAADAPGEVSILRPRGDSRGASVASLVARAVRATSSSLTPWLVPAWIVGVLLLSLRFLAGWAAARGLRRRGVTESPAALRATLERVAARLRVSRPVLLLRSVRVAVPTTLGAFRPAILLPVSAVTGLPPEALEAILAHELAHIRRHDYLVNLLQTAAETLLFYHPAVWWVSHRIRVERENCCDDAAVSVMGDARAYARALVGLEEIRWAPARLAVAANGGTLWSRVQRLLPAPASPAEGASRWLAAILALGTIGTLGAAARITSLDGPSAATSSFGKAAVVTLAPAAGSGPNGTLAGVAGDARGALAGGEAEGVADDSASGLAEAAGSDLDQDSAHKTSEPDDGRLSAEDLSRLKIHGVTPEFLGALAAHGYKRATVDDLVSLRVHGVTPEYISEIDGLLGSLSLDELVSLKIHGVSADFIRGFRAAGYESLSADEARSLRIHGVSPETAAEWTKVLSRRPGLDDVLSARIHGVTPDFAREMRSLGIEPDLDELVGLRIHGVTPDYVRAMKSLGYSKLSADDAVSARIHGVMPDFVKEIQSLGYKTASLEEATSLRIHGVTADFIREANRSAGSHLSVDDLLDLRIHRRTK